MERYPALDIYFPQSRESELHEQMKHLAAPPWSPKQTDALGRPVEEGYYYFHHDAVNGHPPCTVCIGREKEGHWVVQDIVPDGNEQIPIEAYKELLREFDLTIAEPAAEAMGGMTAMELSEYRLQDHFSPRAVGLLEAFCKTASGLGSHPNDQERWIRFLLAAYDDGNDVHCDVFGHCLKTAGWWPEDHIRELVHEYDFAMRVLRQAGRQASQR